MKRSLLPSWLMVLGCCVLAVNVLSDKATVKRFGGGWR
jgi:hypothetical protein